MSTPLTRVTVTAEGRSAELLLPSDQPIGTLIPRLGEILEQSSKSGADNRDSEPVAMGRRSLNLIGGPALSERTSLRQAGVLDGAWLMLTSVDEALPEPVVYDVADVIEEELPGVQRATEPEARDLMAGALGAVGLLLAFGLFNRWAPDLLDAAVVALSSICWIAGAAIPWEGTRRSHILTPLPLVFVVWGLCLQPHDVERTVWILAVAVVLTQVSREMSRRSWRSAVTVLVVAALMSAVWIVAIRLTPALPDAAAIAASAAILVLGLVPRWAISVAGLNTLDDRRSRSEKVRRPSVALALATAHRSLQGTFVWLGASVALGATILCSQEIDAWWDIPLLIVWGAVVLLRMRHFPLVQQRIILGASGAAVAYVLADAVTEASGQPWWLIAVAVLAVLLAATAFAVGSTRAAPHVVAQGRIIGDRLEFLAAVAIIPLVVGHFGAYASLVRTFQEGTLV